MEITQPINASTSNPFINGPSRCHRRLDFGDEDINESPMLNVNDRLEKALAQNAEKMKLKWNFDFIKDKPINNTDKGSYIWTLTSDLPSFYSKPVHRKRLPPSTPRKRRQPSAPASCSTPKMTKLECDNHCTPVKRSDSAPASPLNISDEPKS